MTTRPTLETLVELAKLAGSIIIDGGLQAKKISEKASYSDVVTEFDLLVEKTLVEKIKEKFPNHKFFCEESDHTEITNDPTWIIDPIDGTANFIQGHPDHSVSIAYVENKEPILGVVNAPQRNELFAAEKGKGATLNGVAIRVSQPCALRDALVSTGFAVGFLHSTVAPETPSAVAECVRKMRDVQIKNFTFLIDEVKDIRRTGGAAIDLCNLACGRTDAYAEMGPWPWDYSAGMLVVAEAGGYVGDQHGNPLCLGGRHVIAASTSELARSLASKLLPAPVTDSEF